MVQVCFELVTAVTPRKSISHHHRLKGCCLKKKLHLKEKDNSFEDSNVHTLYRGHNWFKRGVKEVVYYIEQPSLNRAGGLRHNLSLTYSPVLSSLPGCFTVVHTACQVVTQGGTTGERQGLTTR